MSPLPSVLLSAVLTVTSSEALLAQSVKSNSVADKETTDVPVAFRHETLAVWSGGALVVMNDRFHDNPLLHVVDRQGKEISRFFLNIEHGGVFVGDWGAARGQDASSRLSGVPTSGAACKFSRDRFSGREQAEVCPTVAVPAVFGDPCPRRNNLGGGQPQGRKRAGRSRAGFDPSIRQVRYFARFVHHMGQHGNDGAQRSSHAIGSDGDERPCRLVLEARSYVHEIFIGSESDHSGEILD